MIYNVHPSSVSERFYTILGMAYLYNKIIKQSILKEEK